MRAAIVIALVLVACPSPQKTISPTAPTDGPSRVSDMAPLYPTCSLPDGGALPTYKDVCDGLVTRDNRACVRCPSEHNCLELPDKVYCVASDCSDPMCHQDAKASLRRK
jgi:hypothetical protein